MMAPCPECKVPEYIRREHLWLNNGEIVQAREQRHRLLFIDSENLDPIFQRIEKTIGTSIEPLLMGCVRTINRSYLDLFIAEEVRDVIVTHSADYKPIDDNFRDLPRRWGTAGTISWTSASRRTRRISAPSV